MPWWQSPFSNKSHSDDSVVGGRGCHNSKPSIFSRRTNRHLATSKKVRSLAEHAFEQPPGPSSGPGSSSGSRTATPTSGNSALPEPYPLPVPELQSLLRGNNSSSKAVNVPPRSPDDVVGSLLERGRGRDNNKAIDSKYGRLSCEEDGRNLEPYSAGRSTGRDNNGYNAHRSAPTSPFASPRHSSPRRGRASHDGGHGGDVDVKDMLLTSQNTFRSPLKGRYSHDGGHGGDADVKDMFTSQNTFRSPLRGRYSHDGGHGGDVEITSQQITSRGCFQVWSAPEMFSSSYGDSTNVSRSKVSLEYDDGSPPIISPLPLPTSTHSQRLSYSQCLSPSFTNVHPLPLPPPTSLHSQHPHSSTIQDIQPVNSHWQKGKLLGRGTFGSVYVASNRETGALCAMKEVDMVPDDSKSAESIKQLEQEIKVLRHLKHANIVQYYGSEIVGDRFFIYLEYVHPGSLTRFIKDHCEGITEAVVRNFTRHILCGLAYLHSTKTIHRDIKGANLLVDAYGVVKLADFGMAKHLHGHNANLSLKGSPYWMAPEVLQSVMCSNSKSDDALAVDIWSLGCTVIEMLTGAPPWSEYEGAAAMFKVLQENPPFPADLSQDGKDFLNCCFKRNPTERPTAAMLLEHRFVRGNLSKCNETHICSFFCF